MYSLGDKVLQRVSLRLKILGSIYLPMVWGLVYRGDLKDLSQFCLTTDHDIFTSALHGLAQLLELTEGTKRIFVDFSPFSLHETSPMS